VSVTAIVMASLLGYLLAGFGTMTLFCLADRLAGDRIEPVPSAFFFWPLALPVVLAWLVATQVAPWVGRLAARLAGGPR
jgi:hypothetical protein